MATRPLHIRFAWTFRDYVKRMWDLAGEDNILFLASGIAFNLLLAAVPFFLLLLAGLGYLLNHTDAQSAQELWYFIDRLLPPGTAQIDASARGLLNQVIETRGPTGAFALLTFIWLSTRLFGSLRSVLAEVFDIEEERGVIEGKLFDIQITVIATVLFVIWTLAITYVNLATTRGIQALEIFGLRSELMGRLEFWFISLVAMFSIVLMFFALYKFLPIRRIRWQSALIGALFSGILFELARHIFTWVMRSFSPGTLYTGTLYAIILVVLWTYYGALVFILGGEVTQVHQVRRVRRLQRETFED